MMFIMFQRNKHVVLIPQWRLSLWPWLLHVRTRVVVHRVMATTNANYFLEL